MALLLHCMVTLVNLVLVGDQEVGTQSLVLESETLARVITFSSWQIWSPRHTRIAWFPWCAR